MLTFQSVFYLAFINDLAVLLHAESTLPLAAFLSMTHSPGEAQECEGK